MLILEIVLGLVFYPDFTKNETADWWVQECITFKEQLDFAGLWIVSEFDSVIHIDNDYNK